ncbi:hypothetical protein DFH27DRAFT_476074 [Peziza echinospora]|nr:hypothetical protein DFH27DRAFT_476074 [Peziza echinospora]
MDLGIFDSLLSLEETYYDEGYTEGAKDGETAGRNEGRAFGFEKGFEKFLEMGKMQGRIAVWKSRIAQPSSDASLAGTNAQIAPITNPRVIKHISQFENIVSNPSTVNDEESVEEVDESLKRGRAKLKIICNMLGEKEHASGGSEAAGASNGGEANIEEGNFNKNVRR